MSLVLSMDMVDELLRVPVENRDVNWAHRLCTATRFLHIDVWSSLCEFEYVKNTALPLLSKARNVLHAMLESGDLDAPMKKAVEITKRNLEYRVANLRDNYLRGLPSACGPRGKATRPRGRIVKRRKTEDNIYIIDEYYEADKMKFGDVHISGGNVNFIEKMEKLQYDQRSGVTQQQFDQLRASIASLPEENRALLNEKFAELAKAETEPKRQSAAAKIKEILVDKGIEVAKDLTVEFVKRLLWG